MTAAPPRRPWWKRKRWAAAVTFWMLLPVAYPVSAGPAAYAWHRGWLPAGALEAVYDPVWEGEWVPNPRWFDAYLWWWVEIAFDDRAVLD